MLIVQGVRVRKNRQIGALSISVDSKKVRWLWDEEATPFRMINTPPIKMILSVLRDFPYRLIPEIGQSRAHLKCALAHLSEDAEFQKVKGLKGLELRRFTCERVYQILLEVKTQFAASVDGD